MRKAVFRSARILEMSFNERLEKLSERYNIDSEGTDQLKGWIPEKDSGFIKPIYH